MRMIKGTIRAIGGAKGRTPSPDWAAGLFSAPAFPNKHRD